MTKLKVLVGCEQSQVVTKAFRALGHEAYSCDILPCSGGHPEWHIQHGLFDHRIDDMGILKPAIELKWDTGIFHPPCDHIAVSGARWFPEKRADGRQRKAIEFFLKIWEADIPRLAIENPIGIMSGKRKYLKKWFPDLYERVKGLPAPQIIQPWQFGHGETKATCLWLKNLPKLVPTNIVEGREHRIHYMPPSAHRAQDRAVTYSGIGAAMAQQWGVLK